MPGEMGAAVDQKKKVHSKKGFDPSKKKKARGVDALHQGSSVKEGGKKSSIHDRKEVKGSPFLYSCESRKDCLLPGSCENHG